MYCEVLCSILIFTGIYAKYGVRKKPDFDENGVPVTNYKSAVISKGIAQVMIVIIAAFLFTALKYFIVPHSSISNTNVSNGSTITYKYDYSLNTEPSIIEYLRYTDRTNERIVYSHKTIQFKANNNILYTYKTDSIIDANAPVEILSTTKYKTDEIEFHTYANELLIIRDKNYYGFYKLEDINDMPYDEEIIKCCEYMIDNGSFSYFEYGYEYLLRHDPDFIKPYIAYYSEGKFSSNETDNPYNYGMKSDYIVSIAQQANATIEQ